MPSVDCSQYKNMNNYSKCQMTASNYKTDYVMKVVNRIFMFKILQTKSQPIWKEVF